MLGNYNTFIHCWWNVNYAATLEMVWQFLKKVNMELTYYPAIQLLEQYIPKNWKHMTTQMFISLFITVKKWKQPKWPSTDEEINKIWYIYSYYSAIKRNEILLHAKTWMNLENIVKWKKPDTKTTYFVIPFIWNI